MEKSKKVVYLIYRKQQKTNIMNWAKDRLDTIEKLITNEGFIKTTIEAAEKMGVTKEEWNNGAKMPILTLFANRVIQEGKHEQFI